MKKKSKIKLSTKVFEDKKSKPSFPVQVTKGTAVLFCSASSKIGKNSYHTLLSCVALKGTVYRTIFGSKPVTVDQAKDLLEKWSEKLPLKRLQYGFVEKVSSVKL